MKNDEKGLLRETTQRDRYGTEFLL